MKITRNLSPSYDDRVIPVEFVVIHHTAVPLEETLEIFTGTEKEVSAHLVIDTLGDIYEIVPCLAQDPLRAWHAGESRLETEGQTYEGFNDFSIGIELVNLDGNVHGYPEEQIEILIAVLHDFIERFPALNNRNRIIGHEAIAGFRGKIDPGELFPWDRVLNTLFPTEPLESSE